MVLLEAMSYGLPCISFDCPSGPSEIIQNGHNGYLVENGDNEKMISAIESIIVDPAKRRSFAAAALERANDFSPEKIYPVWEKEIFND
jgi:glycosyltransferase involved in cell wall biosynthesis